jgi:hypothetical protein
MKSEEKFPVITKDRSLYYTKSDITGFKAMINGTLDDAAVALQIIDATFQKIDIRDYKTLRRLLSWLRDKVRGDQKGYVVRDIIISGIGDFLGRDFQNYREVNMPNNSMFVYVYCTVLLKRMSI